MAKTSVPFYYEYIEQLEDLNDEQFRKIVLAMVKYDEKDELIELDKISKMAFNFIKKRIDYDKDKYNLICERNKQNGLKGGRPKEINGNPEKPKKPSGFSGNPEKPKKPELDIDIELDIDKDIDIDNINNNNINSSSSINIYNFIEQNFGRTLNQLEYEEISSWEDNELTRHAIKQAILNGKFNIKYISKILYNYKMNNITTVQQAQMAEEEFNKNKPKKYSKQQTASDLDAMFKQWGYKDEKE